MNPPSSVLIHSLGPADSAARSSTKTVGVTAVMSSISLAMDETLPKHNVIWRPLLDKFGKVEQWPASLLRKACQCQNLILGGIWRRFYLRLAKVPPWSLVKIADPSIPEEERRKAAEEFLSEATAECCLDPYFAKCLRDMCGNADDLMLESIQRFLLDCFSHLHVNVLNFLEAYP